MSVQDQIVEIIKQAPDHKMDLVEFSRKVKLRFGVDIEDIEGIIHELITCGALFWDNENNTVCLLDSDAYQALPMQKYRVNYTLQHIVEVEARSPGEARLLSYKKANLQSVYKLLPNRTEVIKVEAE